MVVEHGEKKSARLKLQILSRDESRQPRYLPIHWQVFNYFDGPFQLACTTLWKNVKNVTDRRSITFNATMNQTQIQRIYEVLEYDNNSPRAAGELSKSSDFLEISYRLVHCIDLTRLDTPLNSSYHRNVSLTHGDSSRLSAMLVRHSS